jgi:hypothetical protein
MRDDKDNSRESKEEEERDGSSPTPRYLERPTPLDAVGCIALQHATPYAKMRRVTPVVYQTTSRLGP